MLKDENTIYIATVDYNDGFGSMEILAVSARPSRITRAIKDKCEQGTFKDIIHITVYDDFLDHNRCLYKAEQWLKEYDA